VIKNAPLFCKINHSETFFTFLVSLFEQFAGTLLPNFEHIAQNKKKPGSHASQPFNALI